MDFNGSSHLILKEDDIVGVLETDDIKDLKLLNDRVLIKVAEAEGKTAGGLLLTEATKEKPSIGSVSKIYFVIQANNKLDLLILFNSAGDCCRSWTVG